MDQSINYILQDLIKKKQSLDASVYAFYFEGVKQSVRLLTDNYELYSQFLERLEIEGILPELVLKKEVNLAI